MKYKPGDLITHKDLDILLYVVIGRHPEQSCYTTRDLTAAIDSQDAYGIQWLETNWKLVSSVFREVFE